MKQIACIFIAGMLAAAVQGCVYQPINIDVYVPTQVELHDSNVALDAHKEDNSVKGAQ